MAIIITNMDMPESCDKCRWFSCEGLTSDCKYMMDARCLLIESTQDWYGKDDRGGWVGDDLSVTRGYTNYTGYYYYHHAVKAGTRAEQCPLREYVNRDN